MSTDGSVTPPLRYATISVPSTFPASHRPIYVRPVASVTHRTAKSTYPTITRAVRDILDGPASAHKVLVHTVSYALTNHLERGLSPRKELYSYGKRSDRTSAIRGYIKAQPPAVLLAPSLERGIDLPYNDCRSIIVCKVPYPSLGDKQVAQRLYGTGASGKLWYTVETIRLLVQMTGRGMRFDDDYCETYILDAQFPQLYRRWRHLFPTWWREAVITR